MESVSIIHDGVRKSNRKIAGRREGSGTGDAGRRRLKGTCAADGQRLAVPGITEATLDYSRWNGIIVFEKVLRMHDWEDFCQEVQR